MDGTTYKLPVRAAEPKKPPSEKDLEYLRGFFDGDGCVSLHRSTGTVQLCISQALRGAGILLHFHEMLGGGIYRGLDAKGFKQPCLQWRAFGNTGKRAAALLHRLPSMKQAQLSIATQSPVPARLRTQAATNLKVLKQRHYTPGKCVLCSWSYIAGFFDAEGCILVRAGRAGLRLSLWQVNPCILRTIWAFLQSEGFDRWSLHEYTTQSVLRCDSLSQSTIFLDRLLAHGLMLKRKQAELGMTLTAQNHFQVREAVSNLSGSQGFYQRLDEAGATRAKEIHRLQGQLRFRRRALKPDQDGLDALEMKICELQHKHKQHNLQNKCCKLRSKLRCLLSQGASIMPFEC